MLWKIRQWRVASYNVQNLFFDQSYVNKEGLEIGGKSLINIILAFLLSDLKKLYA